MIKIYGSMLCGDCVKCCEDLKRCGIAFQFLDFADELRNLKEFLRLRDSEKLFDAVKSDEKIGIPLLVMEDGRLLLSWDDLIK